MFITIDCKGVVIQRDLFTFEILSSFFINHFKEFSITKEVFGLYDCSEQFPLGKTKKTQILREKAIGCSISEVNGDYLVLSKNYLSLYSVNNNLLAVHWIKFTKRSSLKSQFSSCLITNNNDVYEDDYIITGHIDGSIRFWILIPVPNKEQSFNSFA